MSLRDRRLLWAGGLVIVLFSTALAVGWQRQQESQNERHVAQSLDYGDWVRQSERHPHDAAHQGLHVFKPVPPLAALDPGIDPYVGSTIWLQAHRQSEMKFRPAQDATGVQRFGNLSPAWVLQVLGPLLVIVLGFNAFAGERELGTLRQTLSLGVPPGVLLWGKGLALLASIALLLGVPSGIAAGVVLAGAAPGERLDAAVRLTWLAGAYLLYLGAIVALVLAVSARARTSRSAIVTLLTIWIVGVMLAPRVVSDVSRKVYPSPTRTTFNADLDGEIGANAERVWFETFGVKTQWGPDLPLSKWGQALRVDDQAGYGVMDRHFNALWDTYALQQRAQEWSGLIFPTLALRAFSMAVAGTDFVHHRRFATAAEAHRRVMQDTMSEDLVEHADPLGDQHFSYRAGRELWRRVPEFTYAAPPVSRAVREGIRGLAILGVFFAAAVSLAHACVHRRMAP